MVTFVITMMLLTKADSLRPSDQERRQDCEDHDRGDVHDPLDAAGRLPRPMPPFVGNAHPDEFENAVEILAPGDGDRRGPDCVFEHQVPADDPGDEFTHRGVPVRVRAACDRDHRRELCVAEAGKQTADCRHQECQCHGRPRSLCDGGRRPHEETGADDRADPERHELPSPERALQCSLT